MADKKFIVHADAKVSALFTVRGENQQEVHARMMKMKPEDLVTLILLERKETWTVESITVHEREVSEDSEMKL